jgi:hypothetical protein
MENLVSINFGTLDKKQGIYTGKEMTPFIKKDFSKVADSDLREWKVLPWQEMRIDLIINSIYGEDLASMEAIDVILAINDIDNPLNIKSGMMIKFPPIDSIDDFRYTETNFNAETTPVGAYLGKQINKNTRVDSKRKAFVQNNYALPPTVNSVPISPVRLENGKVTAGGVK